MEKIRLSGSGVNGKRKRIGQKVGNVVAIMLIVSILLSVALCIVIFRTLVTGMLRDRCVNGTNMLAYELERLEEGEDATQLLDELKNRMRCEFTIYEGDVRAYTTLIQNGQRMVGSKLPSDLNTLVLRQGQNYVGKTTIQNEEYLCSYVPTKNANGQIDGVIFAGISSAEANRQTLLAVIVSAAIGFAAILVCIMILSAYLKKRVSAPLREITQIAERLEQGDLGLSTGEEVHVSVHSNDEIGELSQIFEDTMRRLGSYIGEISGVLEAIAGGDLSSEVQQDYIGDFASIKRSMESIENKLNDTMRQIRESAEQVSSGSEQVSTSAQALAQGATQQASSVQELSATISEISDNAKRTAKATEEAGSFVNQAGAQLGTSVEYVGQLNTAMEQISASSQQIGKIIATIENIAFQTNILALNAAVEAARAGAAGKGFAVVADEVRNLATKSDEAAKATKELIEGSIASVEEGSRVVERVTQSLERTNELAGGVTSQMSIVVDAVAEQTTALGQVTDGIDQISSVVQTNSATSEQCAAASEELSSQANLLRDLVSTFRLRQNGRW